MIKAAITLKNGTVVQVECGSPAEFSGVMQSLNGSCASSGTDVARRGRPLGSKNIARRPYTKESEWSRNDIIGIAKIVRENISLNSGLATMVAAYVRKIADNRKRTMATIYSFSSALKLYFKGDPDRVGHKIKSVLESEGFLPLDRAALTKQPVEA